MSDDEGPWDADADASDLNHERLGDDETSAGWHNDRHVLGDLGRDGDLGSSGTGGDADQAQSDDAGDIELARVVDADDAPEQHEALLAVEDDRDDPIGEPNQVAGILAGLTIDETGWWGGSNDTGDSLFVVHEARAESVGLSEPFGAPDFDPIVASLADLEPVEGFVSPEVVGREF